jgi:antitoxin component YwqK of YwqJK toxin-antitoxin module
VSRPPRSGAVSVALLALVALASFGAAPAQPPPCPAGTSVREVGREGWCASADGRRNGPIWGRYAGGGLRYLGAARDDLTHGVWRSWHENGEPSIESHYENGTLTGAFRMWSDAGRLLYAGRHDARGRMDGPFERWWPDGTPRLRWEMHAGVHDGPIEAWYPSGALRMRGARRDGRHQGVWTWWREAGGVERTCRYEDGRAIDGDCEPAP